MGGKGISYLRYGLQTIACLTFIFLLSRLAYPLGPENAWLQWLSRLDPWLLFSRFRWQQAFPAWGWLPLVTIIVTLAMGRVFCGWLCPFGALLSLADAIGRVAFKSLAGIRSRVLQTLQPVKYYWLLLLLSIFLLGTNWVLFFTPFALFSHEIVQVLQGRVPWLLLAITVGTLLFSRVWCSALCPTGVVLSLIARLRLFGYRMENGCVHCGKCSAVCPGSTAPEHTGMAREGCLTCGDCRNVCPTNGIRWGWLDRGHVSPVRTDDLAATTQRHSRRQFFKITLVTAAAVAVWEQTVWAAQKVLRPPGARRDPEFAAVCNRCGRCIQVCPSKALQPMGLSQGLANLETPYIIPRDNRCDLCMACQEVCPTGAIKKVPVEHVRIGNAILDKSRCLAWNDSKTCFICGEQCPVLAIEGDVHHRPTVLPDKCVGCGSCENACPVEGEAAIRVFPE